MYISNSIHHFYTVKISYSVFSNTENVWWFNVTVWYGFECFKRKYKITEILKITNKMYWTIELHVLLTALP